MTSKLLLRNVEELISPTGLIGFGGGIVLYDKSAHMIGAVGVSGATPEIDNQIALTAAGRK